MVSYFFSQFIAVDTIYESFDGLVDRSVQFGMDCNMFLIVRLYRVGRELTVPPGHQQGMLVNIRPLCDDEDLTKMSE